MDFEFVRLLRNVSIGTGCQPWEEGHGEAHALLQDFALCRLRVSKVHHLVHQFVDDNKVVSDRLFFQLLEVFNEHLNEPMQENDNLGCVGISFRHG